MVERPNGLYTSGIRQRQFRAANMRLLSLRTIFRIDCELRSMGICRVSRAFRPYKPHKGEVIYNFKLQKAEPLTGVVLGLKGEPLAGADVYLSTNWIGIENREVKQHRGVPQIKTDKAGRFTFPAEVEPFCLAAVHSDGIAMVTEKGFAKSKELRLQPWTKDNQQQQIICRPAPGQAVSFPPAGE